MRSLLVLGILALDPISCILATSITSAAPKTAAVAKRQFLSTVSFGSGNGCSTVSGLASPQPSGAVCGQHADNDGTGTIRSFSSGSPYVSSLAGCARICLAVSSCLNVYYTPGVTCSLHNTTAPRLNSASSFQYYDANCFSCAALQACSVVSGFTSPQPSGTTCGIQAASDGSNIIISYTSGVFTDTAAICGDICSSTAGCTNVYFQFGAYCILHSGKPTYKASSTSTYTYYDLGCFTCQPVIYSSSSSSAPTTATTSFAQSPSTISTSTSSTSSAAPIIASTSTTSTKTAPWTWTSVQTNPALYNMALTTLFTQSPQCTAGYVTQMDYIGPYLWENSVQPLPTSTVTTCYPPQFYSSVIGNFDNVNLPAFSALVCPLNWNTFSHNATYIACCPGGFGLVAPNYASNSARPFSAALCTSAIGVGKIYDISSYKSTSYWTVVTTTAVTAATVVFADAFDGFTAPVTALTTTTSALTKVTTKTKS